jgi:hypothetical protein
MTALAGRPAPSTSTTHPRERWNAGATNAALLWQELRDRGYAGGPGHVRHYLARFRGNAAAPAPAPAVPKARAVTSWIMTNPDKLARRSSPAAGRRAAPGRS